MARTRFLLCASLAALLSGGALAQEVTERPYFRNFIPGSSSAAQPSSGDSSAPGQGVNNPEQPAVPVAPLEILLDGAYAPLSPIALEATVGVPYSFDFKTRVAITGGDGSVTPSGLTWTMPSSTLTSAHFGDFSNGVLSGTPTAEGTPTFEVVGTHPDAEGRQVYTLSVGGVIIQVTQIAAGGHHTCAVTTTGGAKCWGSGANGQLGNNSTSNSPVPVDVSTLTSGVASIAAGNSQTCAVTTDGGAKCWGFGANGQLGNNSTSDSLVPVDVSTLTSGVAAITSGGAHTCAVTTAGGAKCWGHGGSGRLGNDSTSNSLVPVDVSTLTSGVASISAGSVHTCAVTTAGGAKCWGSGANRQLGNNSTSNSLVPVDVSTLTSGVASISAGISHTCAVTTAGGAKCWGSGGSGLLGRNSTANSSVPIDVSTLAGGVASVAAGRYHTCAVTTTGGAKCWGSGTNGQLGDNSTSGSLVPVDVSDLTSGVSTIAAGFNHTCVLTTAGGAKCWGSGTSGQLGNDSTSASLVPVDVLF